MWKDYYDILGIPLNASKEDIKRAYRILAHQYHPDMKGGNEKRFKEINEAYRILSGDDTRAEYDRSYNVKRANNYNFRHEQTTSAKYSYPSQPNKNRALSVVLILVAIAIASAISSGSDSSNNPSNINANDNYISSSGYIPISSTSTDLNVEPIKEPQCSGDTVLNASKTACVSRTTLCSENYPNSVWDGSKCTCMGNYEWNPNQTACVTPYTYCQEKYPNSIYLASVNKCTCPDGYDWNLGETACVDIITARNESCASQFPNSEYFSPNATTGGYICDCRPGYYWNNQRTACYSQAALTQSCQNSYGVGSYYINQSGSGVCDCSYGYSWNIQRTACITTASINELCVENVGRNSYYLGTITNGKYNCSAPY